MITVLILFVIFSLLLIQLRIISVESDFNNFLINLLLVISLYASIASNFKTINFVIAVVIIFLAFLNKKLCLKLHAQNLFVNISLILGVVIFFLLFYNVNYKFYIPHEDYLFYSRLSIDNLFYKKESISAPYNTLNYIPKIDFYHFFELWIASLGKQINGQNTALNLFFFSYPLATILSLIGIKELIKFWLPELKSFKLIGYIISIFLIGIFFISQPWDSFIYLFKLTKITISDTGVVWSAPKILFVIPIVISLFIFLNRQTQENFLIFIFSGFLYFPLLPVLLASSIIWISLYKIHPFRISIFSIIVFLFLTFLTLFYFLNFGYHKSALVNNLNFFNFTSLILLINVLPSVIMKSFFIPAIGFGFLFLITYIVCKNSKIIFRNYQFFIILYIICISIWIVFSDNLDAKQPFFLLIGSVLIILSLGSILFLFNSQKKWIAIFLYSIFLFPGFLKASRFENNVKKVDNRTASFLTSIGKKRILFLPNNDEIKNIYSRNERVYTGINSFILQNDSLELMSISASFYLDTLNLNRSVVNNYVSFKKNSPYYNLCGDYSNSSLDCFIRFTKNYNIDYICTRINNPLDSSWNNLFSSDFYNFYKAK